MLAAMVTMAGQIQDAKTRHAVSAALNGDEPRQDKAIRQEVVSGAEAARMLNVTRRTVQTMAKRGVIRRAVFPGRIRGFGYTRSSVEALISGGVG